MNRDPPFDPERVDEAVLALLHLTAHDHGRAWKTMPWDATDRLHARGLIENPRSRARSFDLTPEGEAAARAAAERLFTRTGPG